MKQKYLNLIGLVFLLGSFQEAFTQSNERTEAITYQQAMNIAYRDKSLVEKDPYIAQRCLLDIYYPTEVDDYITVVWFHGGGLVSGNHFFPDRLMDRELAIVAVNYRLSGKVKCPAYIEDAAAAVAWVFQNIDKYDGDPNRIIVSGHSAGGYLTSMVGLDKRWLAVHNIDADRIAALVPMSGHTITHFTVRKERGIPGHQPLIDEFAPLFHVRPDAPPLVLLTGDRELEMMGRYEENAYMKRMMQVAGHRHTFLYEFQGFDHGDMVNPAFTIMLKHIEKVEEAKK